MGKQYELRDFIWNRNVRSSASLQIALGFIQPFERRNNLNVVVPASGKPIRRRIIMG
jgi:hypothetical protein